MHRLWFERTPPAEFDSLWKHQAVMAGSGNDAPPSNPYPGVETAEAAIAGGRLKYGADFMDLAPNLKVIARTGIGYDNVDVPAATKRGIVVCNVPDGPTRSTAEHAITLLLMVAKDIKMIEGLLTQGQCQDYHAALTGIELWGRTLGVVGFGRIGRTVAHFGVGLDMNVLVYDPFVKPEVIKEAGMGPVESLDELLAQSDFVSLHMPATAEMKNLMNADRFQKMKKGSILINCARGALVDEAALVAALDSGHLRAAGLDVFQHEPPPPDHPLLNRTNVVCTPHIASATEVGKRNLWTGGIVQALQVLNGEKPANFINPEVWKK
ncbi:MAG: hydroxyacid dehydrogenase [Planctomycetales bacterium]